MNTNNKYLYQHNLSDEIMTSLFNGHEASILSACPGSGKTYISHLVLNKFYKKFPNAKTVVLTHGQNLLKDQYIQNLNDSPYEVNYTYGDFNSETNVRIGLPQSIKKLNWEEIDFLIVDEAHEFYLKPMVQNILKKLKPKHQLLMTGSPSEYHRLISTGRNYAIHYISAEELMNHGVFNSVDIDVLGVNNRNNLKDTIISAFYHLRNENTDKIMVACKKISEAEELAEILTSFGRKVSLSTSAHDPKNTAIKDFIENKTDVLIVVAKGILGFSCNDITALIDLRASADIDCSNQLFARVLRRHPNKIKKNYLRIAPKKKYNDNVRLMYKVYSLIREDIFKGYTKENIILNEFVA